MFHPSAATDTPQGIAIQNINDKWGQAGHRGWEDYKNIGLPVCKKKCEIAENMKYLLL